MINSALGLFIFVLILAKYFRLLDPTHRLMVVQA
jgi:hypothetical protein